MVRHRDLLFARSLQPSINQTRETYKAAVSLTAGLIFVASLVLAGQRPHALTTETANAAAAVLRVTEPTHGPPRVDLPQDDPSLSYALIPAGVSSTRELRVAMTTDPALRWHYANFNLSRAVLRVLVNDEPAYVSYRKDGEIHWTKHTVTVRKGEFVLDDGARQIRARCGNRIELPEIAAETPILVGKLEQPSPFLGPPPEIPETPVIPAPAQIYIPPAPPPPTPTPCCAFPLVPPIYIPPGGGSPPSFPVVPPARAPEPPTIVIFGGAVLAGFLLGKKFLGKQAAVD